MLSILFSLWVFVVNSGLFSDFLSVSVFIGLLALIFRLFTFKEVRFD